MNSGFYPKVVNPNGFKKQTKSDVSPFYFGGSQVPFNLGIKPMLKGSGFNPKSIMIDNILHTDGHYLTTKTRLPFMK